MIRLFAVQRIPSEGSVTVGIDPGSTKPDPAAVAEDHSHGQAAVVADAVGSSPAIVQAIWPAASATTKFWAGIPSRWATATRGPDVRRLLQPQDLEVGGGGIVLRPAEDERAFPSGPGRRRAPDGPRELHGHRLGTPDGDGLGPLFVG